MNLIVVHDRGFGIIASRLDEVGRAAATEIASAGERRVKRAMRETVDSRGHRGRVASGTTLQATQQQPARVSNGEITARVAINAPQDHIAPILEKGRKPGKGVSPAGQRNIERWARRKLGRVKAKSGRFKPGQRARAVRSRVFLITRAIKRRGIPGIHMFRTAADQLRAGEAQRIWRQVVARVRGQR